MRWVLNEEDRLEIDWDFEPEPLELVIECPFGGAPIRVPLDERPFEFPL